MNAEAQRTLRPAKFLKARRAGIFVEIRINGFSSSARSDIIGWSSIPPLRDCAGVGHAGAVRIQSDFNAKAQRRKDAGEAKFLWRVGCGHYLASRIDPASSALRLRVFALISSLLSEWIRLKRELQSGNMPLLRSWEFLGGGGYNDTAPTALKQNRCKSQLGRVKRFRHAGLSRRSSALRDEGGSPRAVAG